MRILFAGNGGSAGSWQIRGEQLAGAVGATYSKRMTDKELSSAQVVVLVKRPDTATLAKLHRFNKRFVWDVVDAWPQPYGNEWERARCVAWLRGEIRRLNPFAVVFPTTRMLEDADWCGPSIVLPHHSNPRYWQPSKKFNESRVVAYEGAPHYLGKWRAIVEDQCAREGATFRIGSLQNADACVALRDVGGYAAPAWKSNVKSANARALGIPFICSPEQGYLEFGDGKEMFVQTEREVRDAITLALQMDQKHDPNPIALEAVARDYREWFSTLGIPN